jgi:chemotaxis signal transduction protein
MRQENLIEPTSRGAEGEPLPPDTSEAPIGISLLVAQLGGSRVAVPGSVVERVLPMAELTLLPDPPPGIAGVLCVRGATLPVVDPRPRLGLATPSVRPDQHIVVIGAAARYLLWVDQVEAFVLAVVEELTTGDDEQRHYVARLPGEAVPLLAVDRLLPAGAAAIERSAE